MHPLLFSLGPLKVETYYVIWSVSLIIFMLWTRRRCSDKFGIDCDDASSVIRWMCYAGFAGAFAGKALEAAMAGRDAFVGGMSSAPGILCGGLAVIYRAKKLKIDVSEFAEAASVPAALFLAVGRVGCFMNGCCIGDVCGAGTGIAVHFPFDTAGVARWPVQLIESFVLVLFAAAALIVERRRSRTGNASSREFLAAPAFFIVYGLCRFSLSYIRTLDGPFIRIYSAAAVLMGCAWIYLKVSAGGKARKSGGFTLVEVMIAVSIAAIIAVSALAPLYITVRDLSDTEKDWNARRRNDEAVKKIFSDVRNFVEVKGEKPFKIVHKEGLSMKYGDSLMVWSASPVRDGLPVSLVVYRAMDKSPLDEREAGLYRWVVKQSATQDTSEDKKEFNPETLKADDGKIVLKGVSGVKFSVMTKDGGDWADEYEGALPLALRVTVASGDGEENYEDCFPSID